MHADCIAKETLKEGVYMKSDEIEDIIIQSLLSLMEAKSYDDITITEIADKAGIGRVTFYRHFNTKRDVILCYFNKRISTFENRIRSRPESEDDYYEIVFSVFSFLREEKRALKLIFDSHLGDVYLDILSKGIEHTIQDENLQGNEYDAAFFTGALFYVSVKWLHNDCRESVKAISDSFCRNMFGNK